MPAHRRLFAFVALAILGLCMWWREPMDVRRLADAHGLPKGLYLVVARRPVPGPRVYIEVILRLGLCARGRWRNLPLGTQLKRVWRALHETDADVLLVRQPHTIGQPNAQ